MDDQPFILLIMNCKKYLKKALFQKRTWIPKLPGYIRYYHVIGDEGLAPNYRLDEDNRVLWVKVPDDYNSLPKKVMAAYDAILQSFPSIHYLFKTDDDQILVNDRFFDILKGILNKDVPRRIHYGGFIVDVKHKYLSQYHKIHPELPEYLPILQTKYCSGRFYFLSREAATNLLSRRQKVEKEYLEDYAVGYYLDPVFKHHMLHLETNKFFTDIERSDFPLWVSQGKIWNMKYEM